MICPRCDYDDVAADTCPRCGVVVAKYRPEHSRPILSAARAQAARPGSAPPPARRVPASDARPRLEAASQGAPNARAARLLLLTGVLSVAGTAAFILAPRPGPVPRDEAPPPAPVTDPAARQQSAFEAPPQVEVPPLQVDDRTPQDTGLGAGEGLGEDDFRNATAIAARVPGSVSAHDLEQAEALYARHAENPQLRGLLASVLMSLGKADLDARRFGQARARFERAAAVDPSDARPWIGLHNVGVGLEDWPQAESAVRAALARDAGNRQAQRALAYALFRQDRNREALEVLRSLLAAGDDADARGLLERIERSGSEERGMTERRLAHFHVRYDGEAHEDVGREILRALERHHATLTSTFDHALDNVVPVILFSREAYYGTGAPAWSGGAFDQIDGRIRIPIGGLTASLTPEMEGTLIHELTHAVIHDRTRGHAPRDVHEGLAQYMEGKRIERLLDDESAAALAGGHIGGVIGFYLESLSFAEYMLAQRGQGGANDLLRVMGETGDVERAFREVYGRDHNALRQAWRERFRQQTGG